MELTRDFFVEGKKYKTNCFEGIFVRHTDAGIYFEQTGGLHIFIKAEDGVGFHFETEKARYKTAPHWELVNE